MSPPPMTYSSTKSTYGLPPPSGDVPLSAERAMMDEIRSKLERTQRRLARNAPSSATSVTSLSSKSPSYLSTSPMAPSSHSGSHINRSSSRGAMPRSAAVPSTSDAPYGASSSTSQLPRRHHALPLSSNRRSQLSKATATSSSSSSTTDMASTMRHAQYKSRSKYADSAATFDTDPLNGGPPVMATPYLVYSSSRVPMSSNGSSSSRPSLPTQPRAQQPPSTVPSALRSGVAARPPSSRVRFQGHETRDSPEAAIGQKDDNAAIGQKEDDDAAERKRRQALVKERETRHLRHREQELRGQQQYEAAPLSPIATATRGRRADNPPSSAIKLSAYDDMAHSTVGRQRRSSIGQAPPKSDIQVSAFDEARPPPPRRRSSQEGTQQKEREDEEDEEQTRRREDVGTLSRRVDTLSRGIKKTEARARTQVMGEHGRAKISRAEKGPPPVLCLVPRLRREVADYSNVSEDDDDGGDTSAYETDDSYDFSDFDTDSTDAASRRVVVVQHSAANQVADDSINDDDGGGYMARGEKKRQTEADEDDEAATSSATDWSTVEGSEEEQQQPVSKLTAKDLALYALGRASTCVLSDHGSPVSSLNANGSLAKKQTAALESCAPPPTSYTPTSSAFPSSRALEKRPATTGGRTRDNHMARPSSSTSVSSYVRRSRPRAPMDLKNHLPPSIGVLSGLSSGSSTFALEPSCFYDVTWKSGEFAFSVQRVYTDENEFEFDDRGDEPQLFLRMLLNTERSVCKSFRDVRVGDVLIRVGDTNVSELGLEGSGTVLTKFFAKLMAQTPIRLTFQRMSPSDWEGGVEL